MTTGLPDRLRPERRQQILPEGVVRAKDNVDDFSFTNKPRQEEAEHNMGYYMVELNNRNLELEDEVARQDKELRKLRQQVAEYQRKEEKQVFAIDPAALPGMSDAAQLAKQRESIRRLEQKNKDMVNENDNLRHDHAVKVQQLHEQRSGHRTKALQLTEEVSHWKAQAEHHETEYHYVVGRWHVWRAYAVTLMALCAGLLIWGK